MDRSMNEKRCFVQDFHSPMIKDVAFVIYSEQVALVDEVEVDAERIDPERIGLNGISDGDVTSWAFIELIVTEDSICGC